MHGFSLFRLACPMRSFSSFSCAWKAGSFLSKTTTNSTCLSAPVEKCGPALTSIKIESLPSSRNYAKKAALKGKGSKPKAPLSDEQMLEVVRVDILRTQMTLAINNLKEQFISKLSNRSHAGGLEQLPVVIEETEFPLNEIAQISKKSPQLVVINMSKFPEGLKAAVLAIQKSGTNAGVQQEGTTIYITFPKMTREHRELQVKSAKQFLNETKDELRGIQNRFVREVKIKKDNGVSEDLAFNILEQIKFICDSFILEAEKLFKAKEKELLGE